MSVLKPEGSLMLGAATAAMVYGVYSYGLPSVAEVHATQAHDKNVEAGRKKAAWTSAVIVSAVSLIAKDKTIFVLGGLTLILVDWNARHANAVSPDTGKLVDLNGYTPAQDVGQAAPVEPPVPGQAAF